MLNWEPLYPAAVYLSLAVMVIALLWLARRIAVSPKTRFWPLFILRGTLLGALAILLLNPVDRRETILPPRPPSVALLVDCSQSMGLGTGESRIDSVKRIIGTATRNAQSVREMHFPIFRFGKRMANVPGLSELSATDEASMLSEALQRLPSRIADKQTRALVIFSDGAVEKTEQLSELAAAYRQLEIPIHVMLPNEKTLLGDVAITQLSVPPKVNKGDQATIRAVIESRGFENERAVVSIRRADAPQSSALASIPITLVEGETRCELVVTADPAMGELAIDVPVRNGEAVAINNRVPFQIIQRERKLKVLYMEGTSAQESRWLQDALHADSDMQCVAMSVNNQYADRPRLQRTDDPYKGFPTTRAELFQYDVVICSDISFKAFTPEQIDWTVELVDRRGGGFVMIGGFTSFGAGGWDRTPWEGLIPFDMTGRRDFLNQGFQVSVPEQVQSHPIWQIVDEAQSNRQVLAAMPPFSGTNLISRVKPAATLLGQTQTPLANVGIMPVFACETYGRGRTFAMSTDTTYGWGSRFEREWGQGDNRYYQKFWRNVIRWLAENSQASSQRLLLRTDQVIYSPQEPIELVAEAFDKEFRPATNYRVTAQLLAGRSSSDQTAQVDRSKTTNDQSPVVTLKPNPATMQYTATLASVLPAVSDDQSSPLQPVHLLVTAWEGDQAVATNTIDLQLMHRSSEWLRPQAKPENMQMVAQQGGGSVISSASDLETLFRSFDIAPGEVLVHQLPLWDHWTLWALFLAVLAIDWILRRRSVVA